MASQERSRPQNPPRPRMPADDSPASAPPPISSPTNASGASAPPQVEPRTEPSVAGSNGPPAPLEARRAQFMIASRQNPGLQPLSADLIAQQVRDLPDVEYIKTVDPPRLLGLQSNDASLNSVIVARMTFEKARLLQAQAANRLVVERDPPLTFTLAPGPSDIAVGNPGVIVPHADGFSTTIEVRGDGAPLAGAEVYVFGSMWPVQAVTDESGRAEVNVVGESPETIRALYVKPKVDYWSYWLPRPQLVPGGISTAEVKPLGTFLKDFPDRQPLGWGERAMGLDQVPLSYDGAGIKIAIIDSGAAQGSHRNLRHTGPGLSIVGPDKQAWTIDTIGHGSHCAGIIGGGPAGGSGVRGFAPAAEIHICRIFPGGRFTDLIAALDYCVENGIDVVNMSLGGGEPSRIIEERLVRAKEMGVACIVAAGNSGGPVQFPASTPHVLAVSAIGKWGEFPADSYHALQALDGFESRDGYFPAKFSCFGPEIDVCAPGVAIVSSLPADGFAAWDGTSMATPHVTGLAALVFAHHPDFKGAFQTRDARRVERLFQILKESAIPLQLGGAERVGAGLPFAPKALGLGSRPSASLGAGAGEAPLSAASLEALRKLLNILSRPPAADAAGDAPPPAAPRSLQPAGARSIFEEPWSNGDVMRGRAHIGAGSDVGRADRSDESRPALPDPQIWDALRRAGVI
jgi:subtilisin